MIGSEPLHNDTEEPLARLTMHEYILEIVMTNQFLQCRPEVTELLRAEMLHVASQVYGGITGDVEVARTGLPKTHFSSPTRCEFMYPACCAGVVVDTAR